MICADRTCDCGIVSNSLTISGSGQQGDPYRLETNAYSVVTAATRPGSPFVGQFIWETDTQRQRVWTGAHWLIVGGAYPAWNLTRVSSDATLNVPDVTSVTVTMINEVEDSDGFHTGTTGVVTIPVGYGGDYIVSAGVGWSASDGGYHMLMISISTNATTTKEVDTVRQTLTAEGLATTANGFQSASKRVRLEAGASVEVDVYQNSGSARAVARAYLTGTMVRHIPTLT